MGKVLKEILKWLFITVLVGFAVWFFKSIFKTIKRIVTGS